MCFIPTTYLLWVSFSPVPECVVVIAGFELFAPPRAGGTRVVVIVVDPSLVFIFDRIPRSKYNIGTEMLMLKRNLHNSTLRGRTEKSLNVIYTVFYALYDQLGPRAVAAT